MRFQKIKEIGEVISGSTPKTENKEYWDGDIFWVTPKELGQLKGKYLDNTERKITQVGFKSCSTRLIPPNNILFTSRAPIGHLAINKIEVCTNQGFKSIILGKNFSSEYIYYALRMSVKKLQDLGTGSTFKELSKGKFEEFSLPIPETLADQLHIANLLSKAETLITQRKETLRLLDEYLKSKFLEMFGDPIRNDLGWKVKPLGELCIIRRGASPRPINSFIGNEVPWIKIGDGTKGNNLYIESAKVSITIEGASKSVLLDEGSLIFANCGVSLGFARILKIKGCIHDGWLSFEDINSKLDKIFLLKLLNNSTNYLRRIAPDGTQPNLNTSIMKNFKIILPPINKQTQFAQIVEKTEAIKTQNQQSLQELENLYNTLSQKAFRGDLSR